VAQPQQDVGNFPVINSVSSLSNNFQNGNSHMQQQTYVMDNYGNIVPAPAVNNGVNNSSVSKPIIRKAFLFILKLFSYYFYLCIYLYSISFG
jgi:hypothetical protein